MEPAWRALAPCEGVSAADKANVTNHWCGAATRVVNPLAQMSDAIAAELRLSDARIGELVLIRQEAWSVREILGNECLLMRPIVITGNAMPPDVHSSLDGLRAQGEITWAM